MAPCRLVEQDPAAVLQTQYVWYPTLIQAAHVRFCIPNWQYNKGWAVLLLAMSSKIVFAAAQASYWQSQETKQVMEEEDALRSAIFAQMLSASS